MEAGRDFQTEKEEVTGDIKEEQKNPIDKIQTASLVDRRKDKLDSTQLVQKQREQDN